MDLNFTIEKQVMKRTDTEVPVSDSSMYLRLCFTFSEEWTDLDKYCFFRVNHVNYPYPITDDMITVPAIFVSGKELIFGVYGVNGDYRITTNLLRVHLEDSFYDTEEIDIRNWLEKDIDGINEHLASLDELVEGKSDVGHIHDDRYYTESECDDRYYTKTDSDKRYYTKTDSDERYYTKSQSNTRHYSKSETDDFLDLKVDKIEGKQLSTHDFTDWYKNYIDGFDGDIEAFLELHKEEIEASIKEDVLSGYLEIFGKIDTGNGGVYGTVLIKANSKDLIIETEGLGEYETSNVSLLGENIKINWGDGTVTDYVNDNSLNHTYSDKKLHTIRISGVTGFSIEGDLSQWQGSITLPAGITALPENIFNNTQITDLLVPMSLTSIGDYALSATLLSSINLPNVQSIGDWALSSNPLLSSINLPNVQSIGDYALSATLLSSINLPNVQSIGDWALSSNPLLSSINLPNVQSIGDYVFLNCPSLASITISEHCTSIGIQGLVTSNNVTINFNWQTSDKILPYNSDWVNDEYEYVFTIPHGTTDLYIAKGYPSDKLIERG